MSEPIVFISNQRIKAGKLAGYAEYYREVAAMTEASKPGTVAHLAYANAEGIKASIVHIFPDAEAMALHMRGVGELTRKGLEFLEIESIEIYGGPSDDVLEAMMAIAGSGVALKHMPQPIGGYLRAKSA